MAERVEVLNIDLTNLQEEAQEAGKTLGDLKDEIKELKKSLDGAAIGSEDFENKLNLLTKAQNELKTVTKTVSKDVKGSYNALSKEMSALKKEWKATGDAAERAKLGEKIDEINNQLKELDSTVGVSTRNVGNYQSALENLEDVSFEDKIESSEKLAENMGHVARIGAGISGIFEIVQGGMNLMGVESEKIEEAMIKIQSLMAITQGLSAVGDSVESFTKLAKAIKDSEVWTRLFTRAKKQESSTIVANTAVQNANTVATKAGTVAIQGFKAALISTGIGALIVALGVGIEKLITNWDKLTKSFKKGSAQAVVSIDKLNEALNDSTRQMNLQIELMKIQGATELETLQYQRDILNKQLNDINASYNALIRKGKLNKKEKEDLNELVTKSEELGESIKDINDKIIIAEARSKEENLKNSITAANNAATELKNTLDSIINEGLSTIDNDINKYYEDLENLSKNLQELQDSLKDENENELETLKINKNKEFKILKDSYDNGLIIKEDYEKTKTKLTEKYEKKSKEIRDKYTNETRTKYIDEKYNSLYDIFNQLSGVYSKAFADASLKGYTKIKPKGDIVGDSLTLSKNGVGTNKYSYKNIDKSKPTIVEEQEMYSSSTFAELKMDYYKDYILFLNQYKKDIEETAAIDIKNSSSLIEQENIKQRTIKETAEISAEIASAQTEIDNAEIERMQEKLDGMNLVFETTMGYADSIISMGDGLSSAWSNVYASMQNGINMLGESLQKGEKDWRAYANTIGSVMGVTSSVMAALADQQSKTNYENEEDRKKGFEKQKDFQVAAVTMNTLAGVLNATTSAFSPNNAWMTPAGQAAVAAAMSASIIALGAVQISKIKATPYEGGGGDVSSNAPSLSALTQMGGNVQNTHNIEGASQEGKVKDTKIYVTETDISSTQDNVKATVDEASF